MDIKKNIVVTGIAGAILKLYIIIFFAKLNMIDFLIVSFLTSYVYIYKAYITNYISNITILKDETKAEEIKSLSEDKNKHLSMLNMLNKGLSVLIIILYFIQTYIYNQDSSFLLYYIILTITLSIVIIGFTLHKATLMQK